MMKNPVKQCAMASLLATLFWSSNALACATCGCSLSSDGALGYGAFGNWGISLDDSFINQNQLRRGTGSVSQQQAQASTGQEVENQTVNRYVTLGVSYANSSDWNFKLSIPYTDRSHTTYGTDATLSLSVNQLSSAGANGLGDLKLLASYQGFLPSKNLGVQFGMKLPTGDYGGAAADNSEGRVGAGSVGRNPAAFGPTGNAGMTYLDTSLNVGNGSTVLILGS